MLNPSDRREALKFVALYTLAATAWVALSDYATDALISDRSLLLKIDTFKGVAFIALSALLTYKVIHGQFRHRSEALAAVRELTRAHRMAASINAALIRARSRQELFDAVVQVAVDEGGYAMAWVGLAQHDPERSVRLVAQGGKDPRFARFAETARAVWSDTPQGAGPTGIAIRTGRMSIVRSASTDPSLTFWRDVVKRIGFDSVVSLPLRQGGAAIGALTMYSDRRDPFDPAETDLLEKMAASLGYALDKLTHEEAERALSRANRMISACDRAMIRAGSRAELFDAVTRVAVEEGGYLMSWVGLAQDDAAKTVLPVAHCGSDDGYLEAAKVVWADEERGRGPTGTAIRTGRLQMSPFQSDFAATAVWREEALRRGFAASIALPLRQGPEVIGSLTLYTGRQDRFDDGELTLLEKLAASISYALDNLSRQENERARVEQLRKLSHAVENSPSSIVITDVKGIIEYVNAKFTAVTGYTAAEALGKTPRLLKSGETAPEEYAKLWATIASGREWHGEFHNRNKFGELFWERASISPIKDEDGRIVNYIAVKEDITHQRLLEAQLRQSQKMEAIGALAGGVAHDFNNILTVIQGHCSLLELSKLPSDDVRESVAEIQTSVERAAALTRQLLTFGRRQRMQLAPVDVCESAGRMCRMLTRLMPESVLLHSAAPREPLFVKADSAMIDQTLMNLVLNSRDAIAAHGRIDVEVRAAQASERPEAGEAPHGWVVLRVTDDGRGIPKELLSRIFEPFFTTKAQGKGSGLGLAVVDGIVRQHKGHLTVDSTIGQGTSFSIYLPRETAAPDPEPAAGPGPVRGGAETILIAEDEESLRRLCVRSLEALGYRVLEAPTGDAAADLWDREEGGAALLITDMVMPGTLNGERLAQRLRAKTPGLRVLYMSGYTPSDGTPARLPANSEFIQKPFKPEELARVVRSLLDRA